MKLKSNFLSIFAMFALSMAATSTVWAAQRTLTADGNSYYIKMPKTGTDTLVVPDGVSSFTVYDDGGKNGYFSSDCDGYLVMRAPEGYLLRTTGYVSGIYNSYAVGALRIWGHIPVDGNGDISYNESESMGLFLGNVNVPNRLSDDRDLMFRFWHYNKNKGTSGGMNLTVTVVDPSEGFAIEEVSVQGGSLINPPATAAAGEVVSVTATPAEGYAFDHIEVYDERENPIAVTGGTWLTSATGSFVMPATNAVVTPVFVAENEGPRLDMSWNGVARYTIPEGLKALSVYDYQFSENFECGDFSSPLVLTAPDGYIFMLYEDIARQSNESSFDFFAFDGDYEDPIGTSVELMSSKEVTSGRKLTLVHRPTCEAYGKMGVKLLDASVTHSVEVRYKGDGYGEDGLSSASAGNTIKLTATPNDGYMIGNIFANAYDEDDSWTLPIIGGKWYTGNDYSFNMPYADVEVYVEFVEKMTTADEGLFIEMPQRDSMVAMIPVDVESFSVRGGCYWENCKGTLVLAAPEGYKFQLSGSVDFEGENASLTIFDGSIAKALQQLELSQDDDVELNSSGDTLTLRNQAVDSYVWMDLRVAMYNPNKKYRVTVYDEIENGFISADLTEAAPGDTVTLTATPDEGYLLDGFYVAYGNDNEIPFVGGRWYNNTAKFVMPTADVNVSAWFDKPDDYANFYTFIPTTGTLSLDIPSKMPYFNVRTEVDNNWEYHNNSDGTLELTAPEGYVFMMSGGLSTDDDEDVLTIYDGIGENAEKMLEHSSGNIKEMYSTGRSVTIHFKSNANGVSYGLGLDVYVLKKTEMAAITVMEYADGFTEAAIDGNYVGNKAVNIPDAFEVDWIDYIREFPPNVPSTVVLPFSLPEGATTNGKFYTLHKIVQVEGEYRWKATMKWIGENELPEANTPYAVIVPEDDCLWFGLDDGQKASFKTTDIVRQEDSTGMWYFTGTYEYKTWDANDEELGLAYGFNGDKDNGIPVGKFVKIGDESSANPMRAYISKMSDKVRLQPLGRPLAWGETSYMSSTELPENIDVEFVDQDEKPMAIGRMNTVTGEFKIDRWYDLKGRSTNKKPTSKGAFYNKKVIVK